MSCISTHVVKTYAIRYIADTYDIVSPAKILWINFIFFDITIFAFVLSLNLIYASLLLEGIRERFIQTRDHIRICLVFWIKFYCNLIIWILNDHSYIKGPLIITWHNYVESTYCNNIKAIFTLILYIYIFHFFFVNALG